MASSVYKDHTVRIASFFKNAGTRKEITPSLRTQSVGGFEKATAHFTFYKDAACTEVFYYNDYKINRCAAGMGLGLPTVQDFSDSTWTLKFQDYEDEVCTVPMESSWTASFHKNQCYQEGDLYVTLNVIAEPRKGIPHGGNAIVFYNNEFDCKISKHGNLGRSVFVATWPMNTCSYSAIGDTDWKATSCDDDVMTFTNYESEDLTCTNPTEDFVLDKTVESSAACSESSTGLPARFRCISDRSDTPTVIPSFTPTVVPSTSFPSETPTEVPTTQLPSAAPTMVPTTQLPSQTPTAVPTTRLPTVTPTTQAPSFTPTMPPISPIMTTIHTFDLVAKTPSGIWSDTIGNIYFSDDNRIFYYSWADDSIVLFAGQDSGAFTPDGSSRINSKLSNPYGIWGDETYLYICEYSTNRVRRIHFVTGIFSTIVGGGGASISSSVAKTGTDCALLKPASIWGDLKGNVYFIANDLLYWYVQAGTSGTVIQFGYGGTNSGWDITAPVDFLQLKYPDDGNVHGFLAVHGDVSKNCLYVVEPEPGVLRKFDLTTKKAVIIAGVYQGHSQVRDDGVIATDHRFNVLRGVFAAANGVIFLSDYDGTMLHALHPTNGRLYHLAGTPHQYGPSGRADTVDNQLHVPGDPKLAFIVPSLMWGDNRLNKLFILDRNHRACRVLQPLGLPLGVSRRLEEIGLDEILSLNSTRLRGSMLQL
jgi:hypothetical protein